MNARFLVWKFVMLMVASAATQLCGQPTQAAAGTNTSREIAVWLSKVTATTTTTTGGLTAITSKYRTNSVSVEEFKAIKARAAQNDSVAQYKLGRLYAWGEGGDAQRSEALPLLQKAATNGLPEAQFYVGILIHEKDAAEAFRWFRKAADLGYPEAQYRIGMCYRMGDGIREDKAEALKWYRKAAEQGDRNAQKILGLLYYNRALTAVNAALLAAPVNVPAARLTTPEIREDFAEALKWLRSAADDGDAESQTCLGEIYFAGDGGVPKDYREATKWLRRAANQGNPSGQARLAKCYQEGTGVLQDFTEAYKWYVLATESEQGGLLYAGDRDALAEKMTSQQIAEAQRRATAFTAKREFSDREGTSQPESSEYTVPKSAGSGFFITEDGFLITNEHVVKEAAQVRLVTGDGLIAARVVKVDAANDLALLKAEGRFAALPVVASRGMRLGSTVATVGFPNVGLQGFAPKLARGDIAALSGAQDDARYFQISVPVQPGNSGGALVEERGNVVGVVSAKLSARAALAATGALPENVNYAVKSSFLLSFLEAVPEVSAKLKAARTAERKFEDVVKDAEQAAVLVLVY